MSTVVHNGKKEIVVIGGNDAGLAAAGRAHRLARHASVIVLEKSDHVAFASCGLPYFLGGQLSEKAVSGPGAESLQAKRGFEVRTGQQVLAIDGQKHLLQVRDVKRDRVYEHSFTKLIIATGATALIPQELKDLKNVFSLRHISDALAIQAFLQQHAVRHIVIVGAGYLGLELADALASRGFGVSLVEREACPTHLPETFLPRLQQSLRENRVSWHGAVKAPAWQYDGSRVQSFRAGVDSPWQPVDMVLVAAGVRPASELARQAGLRIGVHDTIQVNSYQQTSRPDIYAVGDCCSTKNLVSNLPAWMPLAGIAARQGRVAGENAIGGSVQFPGALASQVVYCFGLEIGRTGLTVAQAQSCGYIARETIVQQHSHSEYIRENSPIDMQVVWDGKSKRLLGGTVVGGKGAGHYLNMLAIAVQSGLTVRDLANLDLGYTPPINHMMNPLHIVAAVAAKSK